MARFPFQQRQIVRARHRGSARADAHQVARSAAVRASTRARVKPGAVPPWPWSGPSGTSDAWTICGVSRIAPRSGWPAWAAGLAARSRWRSTMGSLSRARVRASGGFGAGVRAGAGPARVMCAWAAPCAKILLSNGAGDTNHPQGGFTARLAAACSALRHAARRVRQHAVGLYADAAGLVRGATPPAAQDGRRRAVIVEIRHRRAPRPSTGWCSRWVDAASGAFGSRARGLARPANRSPRSPGSGGSARPARGRTDVPSAGR